MTLPPAAAVHSVQEVKRMKLHKSDNRTNAQGWTRYRTLCRRSNAACSDGLNIADNDDGVTCLFCRKIMDRALITSPRDGSEPKGGE